MYGSPAGSPPPMQWGRAPAGPDRCAPPCTWPPHRPGPRSPCRWRTGPHGAASPARPADGTGPARPPALFFRFSWGARHIKTADTGSRSRPRPGPGRRKTAVWPPAPSPPKQRAPPPTHWTQSKGRRKTAVPRPPHPGCTGSGSRRPALGPVSPGPVSAFPASVTPPAVSGSSA